MAALVVACNEVIGIDEPELVRPDASLAFDAPAVTDRGTARELPTESSAPGTADAVPSDGGAPGTPDARIESGAPGLPDASSMADTPMIIRDSGPADTGRGGAGGAGPADASSNPPTDVWEAGIIVSPGAASVTCQFSEISGTSIDSSAFETTSGDAKRKADAGNEFVELNIMNFVRGVQRTIIIHLSTAIAPGKTQQLDDANYVEYYEVKTGSGWSSAKAPTRGGSLRIDDVNGTSFSLTIVGAKMGPSLMSTGTFTLNGLGSANAP